MSLRVSVSGCLPAYAPSCIDGDQASRTSSRCSAKRHRASFAPSTPPESDGLLSWPELLRLRPVWGLILTRLLLDPVMYLYLLWIPQYLSEARSATLAYIGRLAWIPFLTLDIANLLGGFVSESVWSTWLTIGRVQRIGRKALEPAS